MLECGFDPWSGKMFEIGYYYFSVKHAACRRSKCKDWLAKSLDNVSEWSDMSSCVASSLKQQSVDRYVAPLGHIILIRGQLVFLLSPRCCMLSKEATNIHFIVFLLTPIAAPNPWSPAFEASTDVFVCIYYVVIYFLTRVTILIRMRINFKWKKNKLYCFAFLKYICVILWNLPFDTYLPLPSF